MEEKTQKLNYLLKKFFKVESAVDREMLSEYIINHNLFAAMHTNTKGLAKSLLWLQMFKNSLASKYIKCTYIGKKQTPRYEIGVYTVSTIDYRYNFIIEL